MKAPAKGLLFRVWSQSRPTRCGWWLALLLVFLPASASALDPVTEDPPYDAAFPPGIAIFKLQSGGAAINALLLTAAGKGPHATVLLLHGFPGNERNLDLAQALRRAGYHVLTLDFRGMWGSAGTFSFANAAEDTRVALDFLRSAEARDKFGVDATRLVVIGHSVGGYVALQAGARAPDAKAVVAISAFWPSPRLLAQFVERRGRAKDTNQEGGPVVATSVADIVTLPADEPFEQTFAKLRTRPLLLIAATRDRVLPIADHHEPLVAHQSQDRTAPLAIKLFDDDHVFSANRIGLMRAVVEWVQAEVKP